MTEITVNEDLTTGEKVKDYLTAEKKTLKDFRQEILAYYDSHY